MRSLMLRIAGKDFGSSVDASTSTGGVDASAAFGALGKRRATTTGDGCLTSSDWTRSWLAFFASSPESRKRSPVMVVVALGNRAGPDASHRANPLALAGRAGASGTLDKSVR